MSAPPSDRVKQPLPEDFAKGRQTAGVTRLPVPPFSSRGALLHLVRELPLSGTARALLLEMAGLAKLPTTSDPVCWGTHDYWAARLSCSTKTIARAVQRLKAQGLIRARHRGRRGGGRMASTYYLQAAMVRAVAHGGTRGQQTKLTPTKRTEAAWMPISRRTLTKNLLENSKLTPWILQRLLWTDMLTAHGVSDGTEKWDNLWGVLCLHWQRDPADSWNSELHGCVCTGREIPRTAGTPSCTGG